MQGCTIRCLGCFNPTTHDPRAGYEIDTQELVGRILGEGPDIQGVSISGGEPFQQPEALLDLVKRFRAAGLSVLVFSGYPIERIKRISGGGTSWTSWMY
jgi:anaerobic ribonucleoside-triphosphate reductase activating protein